MLEGVRENPDAKQVSTFICRDNSLAVSQYFGPTNPLRQISAIDLI